MVFACKVVPSDTDFSPPVELDYHLLSVYSHVLAKRQIYSTSSLGIGRRRLGHAKLASFHPAFDVNHLQRWPCGWKQRDFFQSPFWCHCLVDTDYGDVDTDYPLTPLR